MKKLLLVAAAFVSANAFAQRNIVWETNDIISPESIQSGTSTTSFEVSFAGKNLGPDTVLAGDTIIWQFAIVNVNPVIAYPSATQLRIDIASKTYLPNDTMVISSPLLTLNGYMATSFNAQIMVQSYIMNAGSLVSATPTSPNSEKLTNIKEKTIVWWNNQRWPVGLSEELSKATTNVYPNPVSDKLYIETTYGKAKNIVVTDITGKQVASINTAEFNAEVDVTSFNKGIYFYQIKTEEGATLKSGKFNVQ